MKAYERLLSYIFFSISVGLSQIWASAIWFWFKQINFSLFNLIAEGVLFIFSSSLIISSLRNHLEIFDKEGRSVQQTSIFIMVLILFISIIGYVSSMETGGKEGQDLVKFNLTNNHHFTQLLTATLSILYGAVIEARIERIKLEANK